MDNTLQLLWRKFQMEKTKEAANAYCRAKLMAGDGEELNLFKLPGFPCKSELWSKKKGPERICYAADFAEYFYYLGIKTLKDIKDSYFDLEIPTLLRDLEPFLRFLLNLYGITLKSHPKTLTEFELLQNRYKAFKRINNHSISFPKMNIWDSDYFSQLKTFLDENPTFEKFQKAIKTPYSEFGHYLWVDIYPRIGYGQWLSITNRYCSQIWGISGATGISTVETCPIDKQTLAEMNPPSLFPSIT